MITHKEKISLELRTLYASNGYKFFRMSRFEEYDFYADKKDFLRSKRILTFTDANGRLMALRPDVTLSLIKRAGKGKYYYSENVYRVPRNSSSFREISQCGVENIGEIDGEELRGVIELAILTLEKLAEGRKYILAVGDAEQILQNCGGRPNDAITECISQKNIHGLKELGASEELIELAGLNGSVDEALPKLQEDTAGIIRGLPAEHVRHVRIDFSVADNVMYYNGIVFKGYVEGVSEAVLSGGEYNIMNTSGAGFAVYEDVIVRGADDD